MDLKAEAAEWDSTILQSISEDNGWWMEALYIIFLGNINHFIYIYWTILSPVLECTCNFIVFLYNDKQSLYVANRNQPSLILLLLASHT